jgi:hypothetical protein
LSLVLANEYSSLVSDFLRGMVLPPVAAIHTFALDDAVAAVI